MPESQKYKLTQRQQRMLSEYHQRQHAAAHTVEPSVSAIDSIESLYKVILNNDKIKSKALLMLMLRNWLTNVSNFDPVSGQALHTGIIDFLDAVAKLIQDESYEKEIKDRIYRIVSHTKDAVLAIMEHTRNKILREHAMLPIHTAKEVDSNSVQWLSRQPGRTLREKLSGKPYIKAVKRRHSVDTTENRLFKAFLLRLEQILFERQGSLNNTNEENICEGLLVSIGRWRRSEDASEIGPWGNLPPNNTLLQDKHYRKIWDGWLWLQDINEKIKEDSKRLHRDFLSVIYWNTLSLLNHSGRFRTVQQPVDLNYDDFSIIPALPIRGYLFPADDITLPAEIISVDFSLSDDTWEIRIGRDKYLLQIVSGSLIIQKAHGTKKKLKIETSTLKDIPKTILSLIMNAPFEYSEPINNQSGPICMDRSVVDLYSIRPTFTNTTGSQAYLPFRLLLQNWKIKDGSLLTLDCGDIKAITLDDDIETISIRSLFLLDSTLSEASKSSAAMFFVKKLNNYISVNRLTYLIPDWTNEFDLESIRKGINFYFKDSAPLPSSIAAIFAWQSSDDFKCYNINDNSEILVIDSFPGGFSVTPVTAMYDKKVKELLPEYNGITWERHPTFIIDNKSVSETLSEKFKNESAPFPEKLIELFGLQGMRGEAGKFTVENKKNRQIFHFPQLIEDIFKITDPKTKSSYSTDLKKYIDSIKEKKVIILSLNRSIILDPLLQNSANTVIEKEFNIVEGAVYLDKWQKELESYNAGTSLWRDHLPELSIRIVRDGHFENFYLVKDATVIPQRGRAVDIPVKEYFTLPGGQNHYSFPLQQGEGNKSLKFVAYLKSPAFPLKKDVKCKLKMTYTYGADDPYELKFIPLDSAEEGFKSIRVEWRSASESEAVDLENLPVPDFPPRKTWADFQKFPKKDGKSFSDLLTWMERAIASLDSIKEYGRIEGPIEKWIHKSDDNIFCFIDDTLIHKNNLMLRKDEDLPTPGELLSFYKIKNDKGKFSAKDVIIGKGEPRQCFLSQSLRFPVLTIWNHGHSLSEPDVPEHFRNTVFKGIQNALTIIASDDMPGSLKKELFFFLCCLHKDAPDIVATRLLNAVKDKSLQKHYKNIAFAIGTAEMPWQQRLLENVINPIDNDGLTKSITMGILSIALWRSKALINKLTEEEVGALTQNLYGCLEFDLQKDEGKRYQATILCKHLELLLALLRSRENDSENFKMILAPNKALTQKYVTLVDKISRIVIENKINLKSRISLQIEKPEMFRNTPDLLYALRMYLTGDSGANTIVITGVSAMKDEV